jgi:hypothetical protein
MSTVIATFGIWQVTSDGIECTNPPYSIGVPQLFDTREENGTYVWEYPIHLAEKSWLMGAKSADLQDFNKAFDFARRHFAAQMPASTPTVSEPLTLAIQKQLNK